MEPIASAVDRITSFAKSADGFVKGAFQRRSNNFSNRNPVEILKRLQREAFSELMKLRDRQDKVERVLSAYKGKGSPFQGSSTHMKGVVEMGGALFLVDNDIRQTLEEGGISTGINMKFIFETLVRQKDTLVAEFMATQRNLTHHDDFSAIPLELTKLKYSANINDSVLLSVVPLGAQLKDFGITSIDAQGQISLLSTPLLHKYHDFATGITVKGSNFAASFGELVSGLGLLSDKAAGISMSTIAQATLLPLEGMEVNASALWKVHGPPSQLIKFGRANLEQHRSSNPATQESPSGLSHIVDDVSAGSLAFTLDSCFDDSTNIAGWVKIQRSTPRAVNWGFSVSDIQENDIGWGFRVGGKVEEHVLMEGFLNLNFGKRFSIRPGVTYMIDGRRKRTPAITLHSKWSM